jgi:hypothetical protein
VQRLKRPEVLNSGYHLRLSKLAVPRHAVLQVHLWEERADGVNASVPLGTITGAGLDLIETSYRERYQPLMLTGMGRSGTSLMMHLLSGHPEILVPGPHPFEMRQPVWLWRAAQVMSSPANPGTIGPDDLERSEPESLGSNPYRSREWEKACGVEAALQWQERDLPLACIDFCKRQTDEFVDRCCTGRPTMPTYVAQKMLISPLSHFVGNIYADARQILLVRDFRDVWLSARSFNKRRGSAAFGRDQFADDLAWLRGLAYSSRQMRRAHEAAGPRTLLVRFEQLMRDPHATLEQLFVSLGVDASRERIRAIVAGVDGDTASHRTSAAPALSGRWRTEMTAYELMVSSEAFGDDLRYFGYET